VSERIHFASDLHLGSPDLESSRERELMFIDWLNDVSKGQGVASDGPATEIHLLGDIFDFWFEYKHVVPKGGVRILSAIARIVESGIPVHYHVGNHDLWTFGYLESELGVILHREPIVKEFEGLKCLIGHGDGLGPGERGYKVYKKLYTNRVCQFLFRWIHPDIGISLANYFSESSRKSGGKSGGGYTTAEGEYLYQHSLEEWKKDRSIDCFVFGHRHIPLDLELKDDKTERTARYINIGDWINHFSSAKIIDGKMILHVPE